MPPRRLIRTVKREYEQTLRDSTKNGWQVKCVGDGAAFVLYDIPPSDDTAKELCAGCPFFGLCNENAEATKPTWGVYAGRVWVDDGNGRGVARDTLPEVQEETQIAA